MNQVEFFDSHAHYNDEKFNEDREELITEIYKSGVTKLINAGYSLESSKYALEIAKKYEWIYTISGISPNDIPEGKKELQKQIEELVNFIENEKNTNKIVGIGEIGLDYYWEKDDLKRNIQKEAFIKQIEIANKFNLPIVIHTRDAVMDTLEILKKYPVTKRGVFHCCPLNRELVKEALKLEFYISFAGPITFKNSKNASEIINMVPLDKILIETDSPYLSPEPNRGKRNDSRNVKYMAEKIASVKNISLEEVARITYENACKIFSI
jgi:TatD DNase family protein